MNIIHRAIKKTQIDGFSETLQQSRYEIWKKISDPLINHIYSEFSLLERNELRNSAVITLPTDSEYIKIKEEKDIDIDMTQFYYRPGERFVTEIEDAHVVGRKGFAVTSERQIIVDCVAPPWIVPRRPKLSIRAAVREMGYRGFYDHLNDPEEYISLASHVLPPFSNYYHWTVENMLKIFMLEEYGKETGRYPTLLVPKDCPGWMEETLEIIDYPGDVLPWSDQSARIGKLVVPSFPDPVVEECRWLRQRMRSASVSSNSGSQRLFVSRQDASTRRIYNYEQVRKLLSRLGFQIILPSEMSVKEQVKLFSDAEIVVGPHGAGLTNLLYSTDTTIVELWGIKRSTTFDRLSNICGHSYHRIRCSSKNGDLVVDPDELANVIKAVET